MQFTAIFCPKTTPRSVVTLTQTAMPYNYIHEGIFASLWAGCAGAHVIIALVGLCCVGDQGRDEVKQHVHLLGLGHLCAHLQDCLNYLHGHPLQQQKAPDVPPIANAHEAQCAHGRLPFFV